MIRINRPPAPEFLKLEGSKWALENLAAIAHYSTEPVIGPFAFKAYNDAELKAELKKVFAKCAYCESQYDQSYDGDIEHFRPKGRVSEKNPQVPGYYWLANDWDNLLLSCQHCNQRRTHQLFGDDYMSTRGKVDQFPLRANFVHLSSHEQHLEAEEGGRLLLNPCIAGDNPESHFDYEQSSAVIIGKTDMGIASIEVYALLRPNLVRERNARKQFIFWRMDDVKTELDRYNDLRTDQSRMDFEKQLDRLLFYASDEQPYAGMARFFIKKFLSENQIVI